MSEIPTHRKLAHLSPGALAELIDQYYAKKPIAGLISRFNIDCLPSQLFKLLPPEISPLPCPNCGGLMVLARLPRSAKKYSKKPNPHCQDCEHRDNGACRCAYCRHGGQQSKTVKSQQPTIKAGDLSLEQTVALLSLLNCHGNGKIKSQIQLSPARMVNTPFAPAGSYGDDVIIRLIDAGLLNQIAQPTSIRFNLDNGKLSVVHATQISVSNAVTPKLIADLETLISQCNWPMHWYEDVNEVTMDLALAECKEFFDFCATERAFPQIENRFIEPLIWNLLEDFSPGQCFRIILSGAQYASDFLVKRSATPKMAANYMLEACQRFVDKARKENWDLKALHRNLNCPRSMMSILLHDYILQTSDQGLNTPIALIQLPKKT